MTFVNFPWAAVATIIVCLIGLIVTVIGATWKLSKLLAPIPNIEQGLMELNVKVALQNGRVTRLEEWRIDHQKQADRMNDYIMKRAINE